MSIDAKKLLEGTTPGPWKVGRGENNIFYGENRQICSIGYFESGNVEETASQNKANARLIAAAPDLAARVDELEADNRRLREALQRSVAAMELCIKMVNGSYAHAAVLEGEAEIHKAIAAAIAALKGEK
jgi:hypothetical protein